MITKQLYMMHLMQLEQDKHIPDSGGILTTDTLGTAMNVMNPYMTLKLYYIRGTS